MTWTASTCSVVNSSILYHRNPASQNPVRDISLRLRAKVKTFPYLSYRLRAKVKTFPYLSYRLRAKAIIRRSPIYSSMRPKVIFCIRRRNQSAKSPALIKLRMIRRYAEIPISGTSKNELGVTVYTIAQVAYM